MNEAHDSPTCLLTDDVLALFLDGANDATTPHAREELALHRDECAVCRDALERARRLDALVAATAARGVSEAHREELLAVALASRAAEEIPSRVRRLAPRLAAAGVLVLLGAALGAWFAGAFETAARPSSPIAPKAPIAPIVEAPRPATPQEPASIQTPDLDAEWLRGLPAPIAIATDASPRPARARALSAEDCAALLRSPWFLASSLVLPDTADSFARACAATLVATRAHELAFALLVELPDDFRRASLAAVAARAPDFVAFVGARLRDRDSRALVAAACLPDPGIDAEFLAYAAGDETRAFAVADALRSSRTREGRAVLLLALIDDVLARGCSEISEIGWIERCFGGLPADDVAPLVHVAERSRLAVARRRALLALGALGDPSAAPALAAALRGPRLDEATAAAFAIGRLPAGAGDFEPDEFDAKRRPLLLAALASRLDPAVHASIASLTVTGEERAFLSAGRFTFDQLGIATRLFRDRATSSQ